MNHPFPGPFVNISRLTLAQQQAAARRQVNPADVGYDMYPPPHSGGPGPELQRSPPNHGQDQRSAMGQLQNNRGRPAPNPNTNMNPSGNPSTSSRGPATMASNAEVFSTSVADMLNMIRESEEQVASPSESHIMDSTSKRRRLSSSSEKFDRPDSPSVTENTQLLEQKIRDLEKRLESHVEKSDLSIKYLQEKLIAILESLNQRHFPGDNNYFQAPTVPNHPDHCLVLLIPANGTVPRIVNIPLVDAQPIGDGDEGLNRLPDMCPLWGKEGWSCRKVIGTSFVDISLSSYDVNDFYFILKSTDEKNLLRNPHFDSVWGDVCIMRRANFSTEEDSTTFAHMSPSVLLVGLWRTMFGGSIETG
ncbi:hypothetical protein ONS96_003860 [Cadophora gregata f. sp. sojae]|nr:hypothetical protein ONS96_003860 [Cadophora gregata f. sp. sojae]